MKILYILAALLVIPVLAQAEGFSLEDPILEKKGVKYAETGVAESKQDPRWKSAPLILEFATRHAELYSDIDVKITDAAGKSVFKHTVKSPWLVLWLKPGTYAVHLKDKQGRGKSASVAVTRSHQMKTFKW